MATRVNFENAKRKLEALGNVLHRPLRDVLDSGARVCAISMARSALPSKGGGSGNVGTGEEEKTAGEKAIGRDISRVYTTPGDAWKDISHPGAKAKFWQAFKAREFDVAERFLADFGNRLRGVPLERFDDGAAHRNARNDQGRVNLRRPVMVVTNEKHLFAYVKKEKKAVGFAKGGFADIVRAVGGGGNPRGLRQDNDITASWITSKGHGYGSAHRGGTDENPTIRITNRVPYASHTLEGGRLNEAKRIAHDRMIENLETAVRHEAKNLRSAA